jgi:hypothetical protein
VRKTRCEERRRRRAISLLPSKVSIDCGWYSDASEARVVGASNVV